MPRLSLILLVRPLTGVLESTVYFGTDTHFNVRLTDGTPFVVRRQNDRKEGAGLTAGTPVGVRLADRARRF